MSDGLDQNCTIQATHVGWQTKLGGGTRCRKDKDGMKNGMENGQGYGMVEWKGRKEEGWNP